MVWAATWDMTRDAEMAARDFCASCSAAWPRPRTTSAWCRRCWPGVTRDRRSTATRCRAEGLAFVASSLRSLAATAPACSDHQLAYVRALALVPGAPEELEFLAGLLDGTTALDGLAVDTELRWALLRRLVSQGVRGEEAVDAELSRDATDAGERQAAGCLGRDPDAHRQARDVGNADRLGSSPSPCSAPRSPGSPTRISRRLSSRTGRSSSPRSARCGRSGPRRWRRTS